MEALFSGFFFLLILIGLQAQNPTLEQHWWMPNGPVYAFDVDSSSNSLYLGGHFNALFQPDDTLSMALGLVDATTANRDKTFPSADGAVLAAVSDGAGGWFVGGQFSRLGDSTRHRIAHILPNGQISPLFSVKGFNSSVDVLEIHNDLLVVGGEFNVYDDPEEVYPSGVWMEESTASHLKNFPRFPTGTVEAAIPDGQGGFIVGGSFNQAGDSTRFSLVQVDASGEVSAWFPYIRGGIKDMLIDEGILYVVGNILEAESRVRIGLAAFNLQTKALLDWSPSISGTVNCISATEHYLFIGGSFQEVNGLARQRMAVFEKQSGQLLDWSPAFNGVVHHIAPFDGKLYVAGAFSQVNGLMRGRVCSFDMTTQTLLPFNPNTGIGAVYSFGFSAGVLYLGGAFSQVDGQLRSNLAAVNAQTGALLPWNPQANGPVHTLQFLNGHLYAGGAFTQLHGEARTRLARIDPTTGEPDTWNFRIVSHNVLSIASNAQGLLFVGGDFRAAGPDVEVRNALCAFNRFTGELHSWNPDVEGLFVKAILSHPNGLYLGGSFSAVQGVSRSNLAALDPITLELKSWNPIANNRVDVLYAVEDTLYLGGLFTQLQGQTRGRIARFAGDTDQPDSWAPNFNGWVRAIAHYGDDLYVGGAFTEVSGQPRSRVTSLDRVTGLVTGWDLGVNQQVGALAVHGNRLIVGGIFTEVGTVLQRGVCAIDLNNWQLSNWDPIAQSTVSVIRSTGDGSQVLLGGSFLTLGGQKAHNLARIDLSSGAAWPADAQIKGIVRAISITSDRLFVGGDFTHVQGQDQVGLAALHPTSFGLLPNFPDTDSRVFALYPHGNHLYIGGHFTKLGVLSRTNLASLNLSTGMPTEWNPGTDGIVFDFAGNESRLFASGTFQTVEGQTRNSVAAFELQTGGLLSWDISVNGPVYGMHLENDTLFIGGSFSEAAGWETAGLARIHWPTATASNWSVLVYGGSVLSLEKSGNQLFTAGQHRFVNGHLLHGGYASIEVDAQDLGSWRPDFDGFQLRKLRKFDKLLFAGGDFRTVDGSTRLHFAVFNLDETTQVAEAFPEVPSLLMFPNPAAETAWIQIPASAAEARLQVFDNYGRLVRQERIPSSPVGVAHRIDTASWASGMYYVVVQLDRTQWQQRLVVVR